MRHTKHILALLLAAVMVLSLMACAAQEAPPKDGDNRPAESENIQKAPRPDPGKNPDPASPPSDKPSDVPNEIQNEESGFTVTTDSGPGSHLMDTVPEVDAPSYDWSNYTVDENFGYYNFFMPINLQESSLTKLMYPLGKVETMDEFKAVWTPYAEGLFSEVEHGGLMSDVLIYGESADGDNLFANDKNQVHSFSLCAKMDNYQNVDYSYTMYVATDEESWDRYDYSEVISFIRHYTGIVLTSGDVREMQRMIAEKLDAGEQSWTVAVESSERDNYDNFRITGSVFTENSQCWQFFADRMISKWDDYYDRDALINSAFTQPDTNEPSNSTVSEP